MTAQNKHLMKFLSWSLGLFLLPLLTSVWYLSAVIKSVEVNNAEDEKIHPQLLCQAQANKENIAVINAKLDSMRKDIDEIKLGVRNLNDKLPRSMTQGSMEARKQ